MGFSHSFIAAKGVPRAQFLEQLGFEETDETGDIEIALSGFGLSQQPDGWLVLACDDFEFPNKAPLAALSEAGEIVCCAIEEHVMASEAAGFVGGERVWRIVHNPEEDIDELQVDGAPPEDFPRLRDEARAEQERAGGDDAGVDYIFDVPPLLAASRCGFELGRSDGDFVRLHRRRPPKKVLKISDASPGFLARLFGRR